MSPQLRVTLNEHWKLLVEPVQEERVLSQRGRQAVISRPRRSWEARDTRYVAPGMGSAKVATANCAAIGLLRRGWEEVQVRAHFAQVAPSLVEERNIALLCRHNARGASVGRIPRRCGVALPCKRRSLACIDAK